MVQVADMCKIWQPWSKKKNRKTFFQKKKKKRGFVIAAAALGSNTGLGTLCHSPSLSR